MKILECSSKGCRELSAYGAYINFFGKYDCIERLYQSVKRDKFDQQAPKGAKVDHIIIFNGSLHIRLEPRFLTPLYKLMWCCYLDSKPELVEYASQFDYFNDMFRGKSINCQADIIRQYVKDGRRSILEEPDVKELREILKI